MTRLELATHILATIRQDPKFEVARTAFALAVASSGAPGATAREIAERLGEDPAGIWGQLRRMEDTGILRRTPGDPIRFHLTPKSQPLVTRLLAPSTPAAKQ